MSRVVGISSCFAGVSLSVSHVLRGFPLVCLVCGRDFLVFWGGVP